ncbi:putative quinol monooxygenase [Maritalea sp.]|uniref:putative quinol monooxygenase n=1 Tax=Maritalea sp. TaxID=2003361 RepID=UPI003EF18A75
MNGIVISYQYSGDEDEWKAVTQAFVAAIEADEKLGGRFTYIVTKSRSTDTRTHIGRWTSQEALELMQSREYFKTFSGKLKAMAGDSLHPEGMEVITQTGLA